MHKFLKIVLIGLLFVCLAAIRFFEGSLFYDPLISFYKDNYLQMSAPKLEITKLLLATSARFWINSLLSLLMIWIAFTNKAILKLSGFIYLLLFIVLLPAFYYYLVNMQPDNYFTLFYIRRFLIQPVLVLVLLPAFYYQQHIKKTD